MPKRRRRGISDCGTSPKAKRPGLPESRGLCPCSRRAPAQGRHDERPPQMAHRCRMAEPIPAPSQESLTARLMRLEKLVAKWTCDSGDRLWRHHNSAVRNGPSTAKRVGPEATRIPIRAILSNTPLKTRQSFWSHLRQYGKGRYPPQQKERACNLAVDESLNSSGNQIASSC